MYSWNIDETRQHICRLFGSNQLEIAEPYLRSVIDRQTYARIHFQDAKKKIDAYAQTVTQDASLFFTALCNQNARVVFNIFIREVGAYLTACVQSIHAVPDILAHAIYYSLDFNHTAPIRKARDIDARRVLKLLRRDPQFHIITVFLDSLVNTETFAHLDALANQAKHRSIIFPSINEDLTGSQEKRYMVVFPAFKYDGKSYPEVFVDDFLKVEYEQSSRCLIQTFVELNTLLRGRVS